MLKIYALVVSCLFSCFTFAQTWQNLASLLPKGTQLSYLVIDAQSQQVAAQFRAQTLRTPASVQKLLTATTAKLYLGDDYRYQTTIEGDTSAINQGQYQGDLSIYFSGDPTLTRLHIKKMLRKLKSLGIKKINGNILLNDSHFNGYQWSDGQAWNDLGVCYTAPSNAIIINKNCVLGNLSVTSTEAKKARLYIPKYEPVDISSDVAVVTKEQQEQQFCTLEITRNSHNQYHLWGCIVPRQRVLGLAFSVNDPGVYAQEIVQDELQDVGIFLNGKVLLDNQPRQAEKASILASYESPLLDVLLREMMKDSDNLIADSLFKTIGARYFKQAGNFRNSAKAMKAILKSHGIDLENAYIADGSGLSRHNLMSTELFMSVLQYVYQNDAKLGLLDSFSVAGVDGTLKHHRGVNIKELKGKVIAKTGSLKGVSNLLGIVKTTQGDKLFVLMINGYRQKGSELESATSAQDESKSRFEKAFFKQILND